MSALSIQDQLAGRIEAIERKHATISSKFEIRSSKKRYVSGSQPIENPLRRVTHESVNKEFIPAGKGECIFQISNLKSQMAPVAGRPLVDACLPWGVLATGLNEIDHVLGGGLQAGVHEWYGRKFEIRNSKFEEKRHRGTPARRDLAPGQRHEGVIGNLQSDRPSTIVNRQFVPLCIFVHLAWRALEANPSRWIIWVGKKCFPYPAVLARDSGRDLRLLQRSLFVRAESLADRVWVADLAVRCGLAGAVIADGSSLDMAATRRLQLAAKSRGAFIFLARPPQDLDKLSAASTRWMIAPGGMPKPGLFGRRHGGAALDHATQGYLRTASSKFEIRSSKKEGQRGNEADATKAGASGQQGNPEWTLELLRCKRMQPSTSRPVWLVEWNRAANVIGIHTPVCDSSVETRHEGTQERRHGG